MRAKKSGMKRRSFLKGVAGGAAASWVGIASQPRGARPFSPPASSATARLSSRPDRTVYRGEHLRAVAMPLGGIGTGSIALAGDGGMRQWQVVNNVNHLGHVPHTFFGLWLAPQGEPVRARLLQSSALYDETHFKPPVTANDHVVPPESRKLLEILPGVQAIEFIGEYPIALVRYHDEALPAEVALEAYSPMIPLNAKDSGVPVIVFEFKVRNPGAHPMSASILATLQNFIGWDGHAPIVGAENFAYGSNRNALERFPGLTAIAMSNLRLPADFSFQGTLALAALSDDATYITQWDDPELLWRDFAERGRLANVEGTAPSSEGRTWNGALAVPFDLKPNEEKTVMFLLAWHFPNRYVNWDQSYLSISDKKSKFFLGVMYSNWFANATEVVRYTATGLPRLSKQTRLWRDTLYNSTLPYALLDRVSAPSSIMRSPTGLWNQDGNFHGFEGCCGASTGWCGTGCCPLDCTHVWGYEQSLSRLFPGLERTMRHTDWNVEQSPSGYVFTRTALPFYLPRPWEMNPPPREHVALDGMLSTILKTYREYRQGAGRDWLLALWPHVQRCMEYTFKTFDPNQQGVITAQQYNTYDISFYGLNSFIGAYYLAALRAAEEIARVAGDESQAGRYHSIYEKGRARISAELWNGEYYIQKVDLTEHNKYQYVTGCLSDQLLGQWWAYQLGLGYLLPEEQIRKALDSIVRNNFRKDFVGFKQAPRIFASEHDQGLLICTWPQGGRPEVPTLYSDEVWTGIEYEVAAMLFREGRFDDGMKIVHGARGRYDGRERSPWNDIECGDHYARAMSSWAMLEAVAGLEHNAAEGYLSFDPKTSPENFRCPFVTAEGWGILSQTASSSRQANMLDLAYGRLILKTLELNAASLSSLRQAKVALGSATVAAKPSFREGLVHLEFLNKVEITPDSGLRVEIT